MAPQQRRLSKGFADHFLHAVKEPSHWLRLHWRQKRGRPRLEISPFERKTSHVPVLRKRAETAAKTLQSCGRKPAVVSHLPRHLQPVPFPHASWQIIQCDASGRRPPFNKQHAVNLKTARRSLAMLPCNPEAMLPCGLKAGESKQSNSGCRST